MVVLGVDPSSSCIGLALVRQETSTSIHTATFLTIDVSKPKLPFPKLSARALEEVCSWVGFMPDLVAIEEPFSRWATATLRISYVAGGIGTFFAGQTEVVLVPHKSWKRALTGSGNASPEQVMRMAKAQGYRPETVHEASALGCALYAISRRHSRCPNR